MNKSTLWALCLVNMAISGVAVYFVVKPKPAHGGFPAASPTEVAPVANPAKSADECWAEFTQAETHRQAVHALRQLPADEATRGRVSGYVREMTGQKEITQNAVALDRVLAGIAQWGQLLAYGDEDARWLENAVLAQETPLLVRVVALQTLADAALRLHKADGVATDGVDDAAWRARWREFLEQVSLQSKTCLGGFGLHLMDQSQRESVAAWSDALWQERLQTALAPQAATEESTLITALNLSESRSAPEVARTAARHHAQAGRSEAVRVAAIRLLGAVGAEDDARWLADHRAKSVAVEQALWAARKQQGQGWE